MRYWNKYLEKVTMVVLAVLAVWVRLFAVYQDHAIITAIEKSYFYLQSMVGSERSLPLFASMFDECASYVLHLIMRQFGNFSLVYLLFFALLYSIIMFVLSRLLKQWIHHSVGILSALALCLASYWFHQIPLTEGMWLSLMLTLLLLSLWPVMEKVWSKPLHPIAGFALGVALGILFGGYGYFQTEMLWFYIPIVLYVWMPNKAGVRCVQTRAIVLLGISLGMAGSLMGLWYLHLPWHPEYVWLGRVWSFQNFVYLAAVLMVIIGVLSRYRRKPLIDDKEDTAIPAEKVIVEEKIIQMNEVITESSEQMQEVKLIPNPLPVPKKHVPKDMDFAINPVGSDLSFDVEPKGTDIDYDL